MFADDTELVQRIAVALARVRLIMLERERHAPWARQALGSLT